MTKIVSWIKSILNNHGATLVGLVVIGLLHFKIIYGLEGVFDTKCSDESIYLKNGLELSLSTIKPDGLFYYCWYKILSLFTTSPLNIEILNHGILMGLPAYFIFLILRKRGHSIVWSLLPSFVFIISRLNTELWPYITKFSLVICLLGIYALLSSQSIEYDLIIMTIGSFLLAYIRPEYVWSFYLFITLNMVILTREFIKNKSSIKRVAVHFIAPILVLIAFISVGNPADSKRLIGAFGQHFSLNYISWTKSSLDPWKDWKIILDRAKMPMKETVFEGLKNNPKAVMHHISTNIKNIFPEGLKIFIPRETGPKVFKYLFMFIQICFLIFATIGVISKCLLIKQLNWHEIKLPIFLMGVLIPSLVPIIIIYPRMHYILLPATLVLIICTDVIGKIFKTRFGDLAISSGTVLSIVNVALIILMVILTPFQLNGNIGLWPIKLRNIHNNPSEITNINRIKYIKSLKINRNAVLLIELSAIGVYLPNNIKTVSDVSKKGGFFKFVEDENISVIYITKNMGEGWRFKDDSEFKTFLMDFKNHGYNKVGIHGSEYILIKKGLSESDRNASQTI